MDQIVIETLLGATIGAVGAVARAYVGVWASGRRDRVDRLGAHKTAVRLVYWDAVFLRLPQPARNTYIVLCGMVEGFRPEFVRLGIISNTPWLIRWAGRIYGILVFALAILLVTSGNREAIFSALLALGVAWLLAVPLSTSRLTEGDIKLLELGFLRPGKAAVEAVAKLGVRFESSDPEE